MLEKLNDRELMRKTNYWVKEEKRVTRELLNHLYEIHSRRLYCDYGYNSLHKFLVKHYKYSDSQAYLRVKAVKLMTRCPKVKEHVKNIPLSQACEIEKAITHKETLDQKKMTSKETLDLFSKVKDQSARASEAILREELSLPLPKKKTITIHDTDKFERVRKIYGDVSDHELIDILLEKSLREVELNKRTNKSKGVSKTSSVFSAKSKREVLKAGRCSKCEAKSKLEFDHIKPKGIGGKSTSCNLRLLCRSCNQREGVKVFGKKKLRL